MSRTTFGAWGVGLQPGDFACAIAALGVLQGSSWHQAISGAPSDITARLIEIQDEAKGALPWEEYIPPEQAPSRPEPFVEGWKAFQSRGAGAIRLQVRTYRLIPLWILDQLSRPEVGAESVHIAKDRKSPNTRWHWPLRTGFLQDRASKLVLDELRTRISSALWAGELVTLLELDGSVSRCDLLVIPSAARPALASILSMPSPPQADCAILLGPVTTGAQTLRIMDRIDDELRTNAIAWANPGRASSADWFLELIVNLSHDEPFDVALARSLGERSTRLAPIMMANGEWIEEMRLSRRAESLAVRLSHADLHAETLSLEPELAMELGAAPEAVPLPELTRVSFDYRAETRGAIAFAHLTKAVAPILRRNPPPSPERHLQAQVFDLGDKERPASQEPVLAFRTGAAHRIDVRVGPPEEEWITHPDRFRDESLPKSAKGHRLTVILSEPSMAPDPQVSHIFLPPGGASTTCSFFLEAALQFARVQARITVLYRNRVLQTSMLSGPIVREPAEAPGGDRISFDPEVVVSAGMSDLDQQGEYGAALILNDTASGDPQVMKVVDDKAELISVSNLSTSVQQIEDELDRCDWASKDFRDINAPGTLNLLRFLAAHGSLLYRGIVRQQFADQALAAAPRIQIIAAKPGTHLPVEYFYDRPAPDNDASLCPSAKTALKSGECSNGCSTRGNQNRYVCPLGFWGISRVLEWHIFRPQASRQLGNFDYALQQERLAQRKQLNALSHAVVGASARANSEVKTSVSKLLAVLKTSAVPTESADTWAKWKQDVAAHSPSILILIPHTDVDQQLRIPKMEIGTDQWLTLSQLDESCIRGRNIQPIALLLGCDTAKQNIAFEDFISNFAVCGAAIVVSSRSPILGRQATVLAGEFVRALKKVSGKKDTTFGDVVLAVRRTMLGKGYPMVLSITSYGDADWRL
jgi:hypothetical protein